MFGLIDHVKTARHRSRALAIRDGAEVRAYLPRKSVDHAMYDMLPHGTKAKIDMIMEQLKARDFEGVAECMEAAIAQPRLIWPGLYEFECLAEPLLFVLGGAKTTEDAARIVSLMADWTKTSPHSAIASASFAIACLEAGFVHRGTDWAQNVDGDDWGKLDEYCERARMELDRTQAAHSTHWFWCTADLRLAIHDRSNRRNHWARFERAILTAPGSSDFYTQFAHQLLPRWHGSYSQLGQLCERALMQEDGLTGLHNYAEILATLLPAEGDACMKLFQTTPLNLLAQHYAARDNDGDRTYAVNLYAWADNWQNVLSTIEKIETFHENRWMCINSLEYTIAYALVGLPSDERQRA